jgi:hypothetical protein
MDILSNAAHVEHPNLPPTLGEAISQVNVEDEFKALMDGVENNPLYMKESVFVPVVLREDFVEVDLGNNLKKNISYADFRSIIGKIINDTSEVAVSGILPPSNLIFFSHNNKQIKLTCYYPTAIRPLKYLTSKFEIVAPNMIISHVLEKDGKDWLVKSTKFFCTDQPIRKLKTTFIDAVDHHARIFLSPFSNTYAEGRMCYGGNQMPVRYKDDNLRGLDYYYKFLWDSPFNDDLGIPALRRNQYDGARAWYDLLSNNRKEKKAFPYDKVNGWTEHPDGIAPEVPI